MKAQDLMTQPVVCADARESLRTVATRLRDEDIGIVPVIDEQAHLVGMVSDRDIVISCVAEGRDPERTRAGDLVVGEPVTVGLTADEREVVDVMGRHQVRRLPVCDSDGNLVGIIAQADIARRGTSVEPLVESVSEP